MRRRTIAFTGASAAALVAIGAGVAVASTSTLRVEKNVHVDNALSGAPTVKAVNTHEAVAVGPQGYAVYTFQGETTHHLICKKAAGCWTFWPPVTPSGARLSKQAGIQGKLGKFNNHGVTQLTLAGKPLYYFQPDITSHNKRQAAGDELKTFGSIWHIVKVGAAGAAGQNSTSNSGSSGSGSGYPPGW